MIWAVSRIRKDFTTWDRLTQLAVVSGLILLGVLLIIAVAVPSLRREALIGAGGLVAVSELAVLWGNRGMISAYSLAQRAYLEGDFARALTLLEDARGHKKVSGRALTLLGNTYRQLGRLSESHAVLSEAIDKSPDHYFPRFGFGRTLLANGDYAGAVESIRQSVEMGAPSVVRLDLGEAYYRLGQHEQARVELESVTPTEAYRQLMQAYLLHKIDPTLPPPSPDVIGEGLPYWAASAERFRHTSYGGALQEDINDMQGASH